MAASVGKIAAPVGDGAVTWAASVDKSRAVARRRREQRRSSSANDDDDGGFAARCASSSKN